MNERKKKKILYKFAEYEILWKFKEKVKVIKEIWGGGYLREVGCRNK